MWWGVMRVTAPGVAAVVPGVAAVGVLAVAVGVLLSHSGSFPLSSSAPFPQAPRGYEEGRVRGLVHLSGCSQALLPVV
jgi:hypothetical protein